MGSSQSIVQQVASPAPEKLSIQALDEFDAELEVLINLSNSVVDLIDEGKLGDAEQACIELLKHYPDCVDGLERYGMLYEARGDNEKAIEYYKKTVDFARSHGGFDPEFFDFALDKIKELASIL